MSDVLEYYVTQIHLYVLAAVTTGNGKWKATMPDNGEILAFGGYVKTLGSGAGSSIDIQIRNETMTPDRDYFKVEPTFEVDSATNLLEGGELIDSPVFRKDDVLVLDVDAISTNPSDMDVWILVGMHHERP